MTREEFEWMERLRKAADLHWDELNAWEKKFMENEDHG